MKHDDPKLIDAIAAEYVVGTLRGSARRRFERWRAQTWHIERRVQAWEERLMPLIFRLPPVQPSPEVWQQIERRIAADSGSGARVSWWRSPGMRALAAALALVVVLAGGFGAWRLLQGPQLQPLATIAAAGGPIAWQIESDAEHHRLRVIASTGVTARPGRSFELWALPDNGGAPVSLGLLPESGRLEHALSERQRQALGASSKVAVSLEPPGGSPTGAPTGPVLFVADRIKSV